MSIGTRIKEKRLELGLTQEELAKRLGYKSKSTINKIEMDINDIPQSKVVAFAEALDTTIAYLMDWNDEEHTHEEPKKEEVSVEFQNALKKAKTYSDMMSMSKAAIYVQLTSEYGEAFPADAAQYAVDNLEADYKANALKKAKTYQNTMSMSKSAIYDQLTSEYGEKFTEEEAQYAVDNLPD